MNVRDPKICERTLTYLKICLHISMELLKTFITIELMSLSMIPIYFKFATVLGVISPLLPKTTGKISPSSTWERSEEELWEASRKMTSRDVAPVPDGIPGRI